MKFKPVYHLNDFIELAKPGTLLLCQTIMYVCVDQARKNLSFGGPLGQVTVVSLVSPYIKTYYWFSNPRTKNRNNFHQTFILT